jgi:hypothetical protein
MTDNVSVTPGNGATIATDNIGGYHFQRVKVTFGDDGSGTDVSAVNPLPVTGVVASITAPVTVTGTVAATQSGTWNVGSITTLPALVAGSALIGKVGLDQTTPGTTNKVSIGTDGTVAIGTALPAGTALLGKTGIDQTTPGTTNAVSLAQVGSTAVATGNGVVGAGVQRVAIASDNTTFPVTATLAAGAATIGALTANQSVNKAQINGVTPLMGNGVTGTGSQRVTIASDNTAFAVNATLQTGANVIGALTANQSVNVAQMNGVAVTMGSGVTGTGVQRVVLATDVALPTGANVIGALTANQSVNNAQIAGVTTATGNGVVGTGVQRVAIASDNTAFNVTQTPATPTASIVNSAASTNSTSVKGSAGTLYSVTCSNSGAAAAFVKLYNSAAAPTVGTTVIALTIPIAASGVVNINFGEMGMRFGTGIGLATTNLVAETDATAVAANQVKVLTSYI